MADIDQRVRRIELTFATLAGGAAVLVVVILGFFGYTTLHQIPHEVEQQIPGAVTKEIEEKYPNIERELERRMVELANSERRAQEAAERLEQLASRHNQRLAFLEHSIMAKKFHDFGYIECGKRKTLRAPEGTNDEWVLFSTNPKGIISDSARIGVDDSGTI